MTAPRNDQNQLKSTLANSGPSTHGFAVPSNMVRVVIESAQNKRPFVRPWIGISGKQGPPGLTSALGMSQSNVVVVTNVYPESPADEAGMKRGDIIISLNTLPVTSFDEFRYRVATQPYGTEQSIKVIRRGRTLNFTIAPISLPALPPRNESWLPVISPLRGARVASLSPALVEELSLNTAIRGVAVLELRLGSSSSRLGLQAGDVIRAFNRQEITTVEQLSRLKLPPFAPWKMIVTRSGRDFSIGRD